MGGLRGDAFLEAEEAVSGRLGGCPLRLPVAPALPGSLQTPHSLPAPRLRKTQVPGSKIPLPTGLDGPRAEPAPSGVALGRV